MPATVLLMGLLIIYAMSSGKMIIVLNILKDAFASDIFKTSAMSGEKDKTGKQVLPGELPPGSERPVA